MLSERAMQDSQPAVVVTGSSGGLGTAVVNELIEHGYRVIGIDRNGSGKNQPQDLLEGDVGQEAVWQELDRFLTTYQIPLQGLVNCAGESARSTIQATKSLDWHRILTSNLTSAWLGMRTCVSHLSRRKSAAIVNVGSMYGRLPPPGPPNPPTSPAYQAAKAGVVALTKAAAAEFAPDNIRVNCIEPGLFATPLVNDLAPEHFNIRMRNVALQRSGEAHEFSSVVRFLLSSEASYVNGQTFGVDGGYPFRL